MVVIHRLRTIQLYIIGDFGRGSNLRNVEFVPNDLELLCWMITLVLNDYLVLGELTFSRDGIPDNT